MSAERSRILVVEPDDHARNVVASTLGDDHDVRFASDAQEAQQALAHATTHLLLCGAPVAETDGVELCRVMKTDPDWRFVPVIVFVDGQLQQDLVRTLDAGADGLMCMPLNPVALRARVRAMLRIRALYDQLRARSSDIEELLRRRQEHVAIRASLSPRQREVLELLMLGRNYEEIGVALGITPRTAKFHQQNILQKLGADSRLDLLRILF